MNVIGGYVLRRELGRGGMGVVHLATTPTGGLAAVKVIHPRLTHDPAFVRRFDREVAAARRVARFCTAPVLDAGIDGDVAYLVTEYVKGPSLAQAVREQGPLTGANLEALAAGIATALHAIHEAGVIHRDLKPSNVLLSPLGPRVIDFGIAQLADEESLASQAILGTPAFMAPEQVRGEPPTPAADVYAWGGVIAFAGTGRLPFGGGSPPEVLYRIVNEGPNLDGLEDRMRAVVERAMAKDPARRPSAGRLLGELIGGSPTPATATQAVERSWTVTAPEETAVPDGPVAVEPGKRARRRWPWVLGAVALAAAVTAGVAVQAGFGKAPALPYRADFADSWEVGVTEGGRSERDGAAYLLTANPGWRLWKSAPFPGERAEDVVVSSSARIEAGSGEFGVWCRGDLGTGDRYEFTVAGSGDASIVKRHAGRGVVLDGPVRVRGTADGRVVARCGRRGTGTTLSMWVDDVLVAEAVDTRDPYGPGAAGVHAAPDTGAPVRVRFRSFELSGPKG
ncbi:serine/threonine-protein kinase [Streptosporangium sp. NPDC001559]|uniref:serine/threonine-protein kinase n=1 Tax=Streptosporangium sp. NPDC001559 TaxID=3366187 RepID=UPI0036EF5B36